MVTLGWTKLQEKLHLYCPTTINLAKLTQRCAHRGFVFLIWHSARQGVETYDCPSTTDDNNHTSQRKTNSFILIRISQVAY